MATALTAEEIASLDLSGVRRAVLPACRIGVGDHRRRQDTALR